MILAISHHSMPHTGAHARFDRLVAYLATGHGDFLWLTPARGDVVGIASGQMLTLPIAAGRGSTALSMLYAVVRRRRRLRALRGRARLVLAFGETNLIAALMTSWLVGAPLSIGVRSNVPRRSKERRAGMPPLQRLFHYGRSLPLHVVLSYAYRTASQIVVQTPCAAREFCENYRVPPRKVQVVENDIPPKLKALTPRLTLPERPRRLLFVGNGSRIKGFDVLSRALIHAGTYPISIREATLVGVRDDREANEISGRVSISLMERTEDVVGLMQNHDLLIVPSREDQFPNVVLEALALDLPVIGSEVDGIAHMLEDRFLLFPPGDIDGLIAALVRVSTPEGYARAQRIARVQRRKFEFDWEVNYHRLLNGACR